MNGTFFAVYPYQILNANALYQTIYKDKGYWFNTPESWDTEGNYRSAGYMRPLAILRVF